MWRGHCLETVLVRNDTFPSIHAEAGATCVFLFSSSGSANVLVGRREVALEQLFDLRVLSGLVAVIETQDKEGWLKRLGSP